jgi:hypothetical protein
LKTVNDRATTRSVAAFGAWPSVDTLLGDDPCDSVSGIFPEARAAAGAEASARARSRIRAWCGLAAASAWMILAAVVDVLQRA